MIASVFKSVGLAKMMPPSDAGAIALSSDPDRHEMPEESWFTLNATAMVRNVDKAELTPFLPRSNATGAAVIIAPGGGFLVASMQNEGWTPARWLADRGVAAFVLKYRLEPTPAADQEFAAAIAARFLAAADPSIRDAFRVPTYMIDDARDALRVIRTNAMQWSIDPERVGYLGFSAGAMIGFEMITQAAPDSLPAFIGAIYPSMAPRAVRADAPPLFAAIAADDQLFGTQGYGLAESWRKAQQSVELHVYSAGGHGFGMGASGTTSTGMMDAFHAWLRCNGWIGTQEGRCDD